MFHHVKTGTIHIFLSGKNKLHRLEDHHLVLQQVKRKAAKFAPDTVVLLVTLRYAKVSI
jgi:hypothetical protein